MVTSGFHIINHKKTNITVTCQFFIIKIYNFKNSHLCMWLVLGYVIIVDKIYGQLCE